MVSYLIIQTTSQIMLNFVECPSGCAKCTLKSGTEDTAQCSECFTNYYEQTDGKCQGKTNSNFHYKMNIYSFSSVGKTIKYNMKIHCLHRN